MSFLKAEWHELYLKVISLADSLKNRYLSLVPQEDLELLKINKISNPVFIEKAKLINQKLSTIYYFLSLYELSYEKKLYLEYLNTFRERLADLNEEEIHQAADDELANKFIERFHLDREKIPAVHSRVKTN